MKLKLVLNESLEERMNRVQQNFVLKESVEDKYQKDDRVVTDTIRFGSFYYIHLNDDSELFVSIDKDDDNYYYCTVYSEYDGDNKEIYKNASKGKMMAFKKAGFKLTEAVYEDIPDKLYLAYQYLDLVYDDLSKMNRDQDPGAEGFIYRKEAFKTVLDYLKDVMTEYPKLMKGNRLEEDVSKEGTVCREDIKDDYSEEDNYLDTMFSEEQLQAQRNHREQEEKFDPAQELKNEEEISNATEPEEMINRGLADMINELIKSEYDAITDYNNAISTIVAENKMLELIPIFEDIREEENVHVGQLQKALQQVSDAANNIDKGVEEAEGQLEEPTTTDEE